METEIKGKQVLVSERTAETRQTHVVMGPGASTHGSVLMSGETSLNYATTINNYGNLYAPSGIQQTDHGISERPTSIRPISGIDAASFESRETIFNEIIDTLKGNQFNMIGIWGMGGIGKTTLAIKVAQQAKHLFNAVVMATISQNPNWRAVQGQIADKLGLELKQESDEGRADRLFQNLQSKKNVLIILDDIWESFDLYNIGVPFGSQHKGCKVILTSRNLQVCKNMGSQKNLPVEILRDREAADLFHSKAGDYGELPEKVLLAEQIIKECGGLPLAIAIVAAGLRDQDISYWKDTANQLEKSDLDKKIFNSVELSIKILPKEARLLFLLCSLFPEDYNIPIVKLWLYGLGLNFFEKVDDVEAALTRVEKLTSSLKSSCLLLGGRYKKDVKMHDIVRDAALEIASKSGHVFLTRLKGEELSKRMAISFCPNDIKKLELPHKLDCPLLEILILNFLFLNSEKTLPIHEDFFMGMNKLTVLEISGMEFKKLPRSLECLENLQVLCFDDCVLGDISSVGMLKKLVVLGILNSDLEVLPEEVGQLTNLRVLVLRAKGNSDILVEIGALQSLSNLEALSIEDFFKWEDKNASIEELIVLSHLKILDICIPYVPSLTSQLPFENLSRFQISVGSKCSKLYDYNTSLLLVGCHLSNIGVKKVMKKIEFLSYRKMLGLGDILLSSNLYGGGVLKTLKVDSCDEVEFIYSTKNWGVKFSFPSLRELYLRKLSHLKEIFHGNFVTFNNLTHLTVVECHQLVHIFTCTVAKSLSQIQTLVVGDCNNLEVIFRIEEETLMETVDLPQLTKLGLRKLPKLKCLDSFSVVQEMLLGDQVHCPSSEMNKNLKVQNYGGLLQCSIVTLNNLTYLKVDGCDQLRFIFTHTASKSLSRIQTLEIYRCDNLEVIIFSSEEVTSAEVNIPQLHTLVLSNLPKLKCLDSLSIVQERLSGERPSLEVNKLKEIFSGFPKLTRLTVSNCGSFRGIGPHVTLPDRIEEFSLKYDPACPNEELQVLAANPTLTMLNLGYLSKLQKIEWNTETDQNLRIFEISGCMSRPSIFEDHTNTLRFPSLSSLSMINCHKMFQLTSQSQDTLKQDTIQPLFDHRVEFGALKYLMIDGFYDLEQVHTIEGPPLFLFSHLVRLELCNLHSLKHLWWNDNMINDGTHEYFGLPNLKCLMMKNCGSLRFVFTPCAAKHIGQLKYLYITDCEMMEEIVVSVGIFQHVGPHM